MQNHHEILGESIKPARIKADITVEAPAAKVGVTERFKGYFLFSRVL